MRVNIAATSEQRNFPKRTLKYARKAREANSRVTETHQAQVHGLLNRPLRQREKKKQKMELNIKRNYHVCEQIESFQWKNHKSI